MSPAGPPGDLDERIAEAVRAEHGRVVGALVRKYGDLDLAEDATSEAVVAAVETWRRDGVPPNPGGWLTTTATRRALDRLRRESSRPRREQEADRMQALAAGDSLPLGVVDDDRLRLLFMCSHPALAAETRIALTLRLVVGLTMPEIGRALVTPERTVAQRLTRAKRKIAATRLPFAIPRPADLPARLGAVRTVVYLMFNEGYQTTSGADPVRDDLSVEAIRLARLLVGLVPDDPESRGLLALLLLTQARRQARVDGSELVLLADQDRRLWDRALIDEGHAIVRDLVAGNRPGPLQLQAAIAAVHTDAARAEDTDWGQIVALYDRLLQLDPSPVVATNRAVAVAEASGPDLALLELDLSPLPGYAPWRLARGHLLALLGRPAEAAAELQAALELTGNVAEQQVLLRRLAALDGWS